MSSLVHATSFPGPFPDPPPSQGKGPGNEVVVHGKKQTKKWPPGRKAYLVKLGLKSFVDGRQGICKDKESNLGSVVGY